MKKKINDVFQSVQCRYVCTTYLRGRMHPMQIKHTLYLHGRRVASTIAMSTTSDHTHLCFCAPRRSATKLRVSTGGRSRRFLLYSLYVAAITGALVLAAIIMDATGDDADPYRPGLGERTCWFSRPKAMMVFFGAPLFVVMVANVALFCGSAVIIRRTSKASRSTASSKVRKWSTFLTV